MLSLAEELQSVHVEELLDTFQARVARLKACNGSAVKLQGAELNVLESIGKANDEMLAAMKRDPSTGRSRVLECYGGDCARIAQMRSLLESVALTGKRQGDYRLAEALSRCETIEGMLREAGLGAELDAARQEFLQVPAGAPVEEAPKGWRRRPHGPQQVASDQLVGLRRAATVRQLGGGGLRTEDCDDVGPQHEVSVRTSALIEPKLDVGQLNKLVFDLERVHVILDAEASPPLPKTCRPLRRHQELNLEVPDLQKVVFDKSKKTPAGARVNACAKQFVDIVEIPAKLAVGMSFSSESPWWSQKVLVSGKETQLNCSAVLQGRFELEERPMLKTNALRMDLTCQLECWLSGPGCALFKEDSEMPPPRENNSAPS